MAYDQRLVSMALAAALWFTPILVRGADQPDWFVLRSWSQRDGLPQEGVTAIAQTRDGYLWLGTNSGVARFDGLRFTVFDDRTPGLLENEIRAMVAGPDGSLWIGILGGGVSRYRDGRFTAHTTRDGLSDDYVTSLAIDRQGVLWIGTEKGLSQYANGQFRSVAHADVPVDTVIALAADPVRGVWIGMRNGGLGFYDGERFHRQSIPGLTPEINVRALSFDAGGALWMATYEGVFRLQRGTFSRFGTAEGLVTERVLTVHADEAGTVWAGTVNGLHRFEGGQFRRSSEEGLHRAIISIGADREGGLWVGTNRFAYLRQGLFKSYLPRDGMSYHWTTTVFEDPHGGLWITTGRGLNHFKEGQFTHYWEASGLPNRLQGGVLLDRTNHLLVATDGGLYRSTVPLGPPDAVFRPRFVPVENQPPVVQPRALYRDRRGAIWLATLEEGLMRYQDGVFTVYTTADGLLNGSVRGIAEDQAGRLWVGSRKGLHRIEDGKIAAYTAKDGLVHDSVEAVFLDRDGVLWIGTRRGVSRLENGRFTSFTTRQGLPANHVYAFAEDDQGNLWMGCPRGPFRIEKAELDRVVRQEAGTVTAALFGTEHGLGAARVTGTFQNSIYRTQDSRVWFATPYGVSVVDPKRLARNTRPPLVHLEEMRVNHRPLALAQTVSAPPGRGDIEIRYTALSFPAPEKVRFKHRLDGHDVGWVDAEDRRTAIYTNLPPGRYRFRVIAANNDGVWNETGASVAVVLAPHWYQTWLFRGFLSFGVFLLAVGGYQQRVRRLHKRQRELEARVEERTTQLKEANEELEAFSYSVSHDLRAPLRHVDGFSKAVLQDYGPKLDERGQDLLRRLRGTSETMQKLIDNLLVLSRAGRSEMRIEALDLSGMASEIGQELAAQQPQRKVEWVVPTGLVATADSSLMHIALSNLLGNAWKFTSKKPLARIEIGRLDTTPDGQRGFFVRDNGAGFDPRFAHKLFAAFQRLHSASEFEGSGVGLATVRRIIERHGGRIWAEGEIGKGATFFFTLPAAPPS